MEEQVFFIINNDELVLDKVLVEYNEAPIFFVCKHNEKYFIASCVDLEKEEYIVTGVSLSALSKMLHGKMTMRNLILQADMFWNITVGEDVDQDIVVSKDIDAIPLDALPYENAYLEIATKDLEKYVEEIDANLFGEGIWAQEIVECVESFLDGFNEQCESIFQCIYESAFEIINKMTENIDNEAGDVKEIFNSKIQIRTENAEMNKVLMDSDKYPFAA